MPTTHQLKPGTHVQLRSLPTRGKELHDDRKQAEKEFKKLRKELIHWQEKLYSEGKQKLLILFQALDAGGKDGTGRVVFQGSNPQGVRVTSFKKPSTLELSHDFLWRVHQAAPAKGMIGVFNRSHYEDVLVVRVNQIVPENIWQQRYEQINNFEKMLTETGTTILKFFLHISKEEQGERLQERIDMPEKRWKFNKDDLTTRAQWDNYMEAYQDAFSRCTTEHAPWYIIPSDQNWYRNLAVMKVIVDALRGMNPQFPEVDEDWEHMQII